MMMVSIINSSISLPSGWEWIKFNEVCETSSGGTPSRKNKKYFDGDIPWLKSGELTYNIVRDSEEKITKEAIENSSAKIFSKGTLLIALYGATVGRLGILGINAATNQAISAIFTNKFLLQKYLYWFLFSYREKLLKERIGGAQPNISQTILNNISLPFPPLPEQHQIVAKIKELFSELDNGIESLKKAREQLKTYRQAVLKYAFEGKLSKEWRTLQRRAGNPPEPAEKLLEQVKTERKKHYQKQLEDWKNACELTKTDGKKKPAKSKKPKELPPLTEKELSELPELPQGWCWVRTEQVGHIETGTTPSKKSPENYGKEHPFYKPTDLNEGKNVRKAHDNLSEVGYSKARILPINSILVTCIGATIGKTGIIREEGAFNQQINAIVPFNYIVPDFVYYQAICQFFQNQIIFKASSTTLPILNKSKFENLFFALTSYEEQHTITSEIESRLSVCDKIEQTIEDSLKKAEALRQSILKKAFSGELTRAWREKHPELISGANSAEKLLEKIKAEKAMSAAGRKKPQSKKTKKR